MQPFCCFQITLLPKGHASFLHLSLSIFTPLCLLPSWRPSPSLCPVISTPHLLLFVLLCSSAAQPQIDISIFYTKTNKEINLSCLYRHCRSKKWYKEIGVVHKKTWKIKPHTDQQLMELFLIIYFALHCLTELFSCLPPRPQNEKDISKWTDFDPSSKNVSFTSEQSVVQRELPVLICS